MDGQPLRRADPAHHGLLAHRRRPVAGGASDDRPARGRLGEHPRGRQRQPRRPLHRGASSAARRVQGLRRAHRHDDDRAHRQGHQPRHRGRPSARLARDDPGVQGQGRRPPRRDPHAHQRGVPARRRPAHGEDRRAGDRRAHRPLRRGELPRVPRDGRRPRRRRRVPGQAAQGQPEVHQARPPGRPQHPQGRRGPRLRPVAAHRQRLRPHRAPAAVHHRDAAEGDRHRRPHQPGEAQRVHQLGA